MLVYHSEMQPLIGEREQVVHVGIQGFCLLRLHQLTGIVPPPGALRVVPRHHRRHHLNCLFPLPPAHSAPIFS